MVRFAKTLSPSALLLVAVAACDAPSSSPSPSTSPPTPSPPVAVAAPPAASASAPPAESADPKAKPPRERPGLAGMMLGAAADLVAGAEQRAAIDSLGDQLDRAAPAELEARKALRAAMVEAVKTGKVEMSKLEPALVRLDKAAVANQQLEATVLDALHAKLDAAQRKALVEVVGKRQADRDARVEKRAQPPAADSLEDPARVKRRVERLSGEIGLDADQRRRVEPILAKQDDEVSAAKDTHAATKKRTAAVLAAFVKDTFDASKFDLGVELKRHRAGTQKKVDTLNALLGVIDPEQRDELAATLDDARRSPPGQGSVGQWTGRMMRSPRSGPRGVGEIAGQID